MMTMGNSTSERKGMVTLKPAEMAMATTPVEIATTKPLRLFTRMISNSTIGPHQALCNSYCDRANNWNSRMMCQRELKQVYCCGDRFFRYCCVWPDKAIKYQPPDILQCLTVGWSHVALGMLLLLGVLLLAYSCYRCCETLAQRRRRTQAAARRNAQFPEITDEPGNYLPPSLITASFDATSLRAFDPPPYTPRQEEQPPSYADFIVKEYPQYANTGFLGDDMAANYGLPVESCSAPLSTIVSQPSYGHALEAAGVANIYPAAAGSGVRLGADAMLNTSAAAAMPCCDGAAVYTGGPHGDIPSTEVELDASHD